MLKTVKIQLICKQDQEWNDLINQILPVLPQILPRAPKYTQTINEISRYLQLCSVRFFTFPITAMS